MNSIILLVHSLFIEFPSFASSFNNHGNFTFLLFSHISRFLPLSLNSLFVIPTRMNASSEISEDPNKISTNPDENDELLQKLTHLLQTTPNSYASIRSVALQYINKGEFIPDHLRIQLWSSLLEVSNRVFVTPCHFIIHRLSLISFNSSTTN